MSTSIQYVKGYKYQIARDYLVQTAIITGNFITAPWVNLYADGRLLIKTGFASDGPSAITLDSTNFMRGAFIHDAFYYLLKQDYLDMFWRREIDFELHRIIREDGMSRLRAWYVLKAVQKFGRSAAKNKNKIYKAP